MTCWLIHWTDCAINEIFCGVRWELAFEAELEAYLMEWVK